VRRDGRGGARAPALFSLPFRVRDRGRKKFGGRTKVRDWGREVGGRTRVRIWGKYVEYQNVTLWVPNIGTITSLREGFGGKSPLSF